MVRGKIEMKRIENVTNRQVTYSKRRTGLFKKASELTVLCDAKVSILIVSASNKLHHFLSPDSDTKQMYDAYQQTSGIDLWCSHYKKMQEDLRKLKDANLQLQKEIRQRMGYSLEELDMEKLICLQQDLDNAVTNIRERKYKVLSSQIDTTKKKVRNGQAIQRRLLQAFDGLREDPDLGMVDNAGDYDNGVVGLQSHVLGLRLVSSEPNVPSAGGSGLTTYTYLE